MVRTTVDVGLLREWRGETNGVGGGDVLIPDGPECGMLGVFQGWKAAVDALDQSHRCSDRDGETSVLTLSNR